jgi:hypothetical protein
VKISCEYIENNKNPTTPISQKIAWAPWALAARSCFLHTCVLRQFLAQANGRSKNYGIMLVCLKSLANMRTSLLSLHTRFCVGHCFGEAQYLGLPKGHRAFPSAYSIMHKVSLPQIRFVGAKRCVASCELPGLHGQQHDKIRLGTMLYELSVFFYTGLFLKRQS